MEYFDCPQETVQVDDGNFTCRHQSNVVYNVDCECNRKKGYYGDPLDCEHINKPCDVGQELKCDGSCKPCDDGYFKDYSDENNNLCEQMRKLTSFEPGGSENNVTFLQSTTTQFSTVSPDKETHMPLIICFSVLSGLIVLAMIVVIAVIYKKRNNPQNYGTEKELQNLAATNSRNTSNGMSMNTSTTTNFDIQSNTITQYSGNTHDGIEGEQPSHIEAIQHSNTLSQSTGSTCDVSAAEQPIPSDRLATTQHNNKNNIAVVKPVQGGTELPQSLTATYPLNRSNGRPTNTTQHSNTMSQSPEFPQGDGPIGETLDLDSLLNENTQKP